MKINDRSIFTMLSRIIDVRACEKKTYQIQPAVSGNYLIFFVLQRLDIKLYNTCNTNRTDQSSTCFNFKEISRP